MTRHYEIGTMGYKPIRKPELINNSIDWFNGLPLSVKAVNETAVGDYVWYVNIYDERGAFETHTFRTRKDFCLWANKLYDDYKAITNGGVAK